MRRIGRVVGWLALLAAIAVALLVGALHTDAGQRAITRRLLAAANRGLAGELRVDRVRRLSLSGVTLEDIELRDPEGEVAVRADRAVVGYDLLALRRGRVHLTRVELAGLWVRARRLADGRLNLAAIVDPRAQASGLVVRIDDLVATGAARLEREGSLAAGRVRVEGALTYAQETSVELSLIELELDQPTVARVVAQGGLRARERGVELRPSHASLQLEGAALTALLPTPPLRGRYTVDVYAAGEAPRIRLRARAHTPSSPLLARGQLSLPGGLRWSATVSTHALDVGALVVDAPHVALDAELRAQGSAAQARVEVRRARARMDGNEASARGVVVFGDGLRFELDATLAAPRLERLGRFGLPGLRGAARGVAHVSRSHRELLVHADLEGRELGLGALTVRQLEVHARTRDLTGEVLLVGHELRRGGLAVSMLRTEARGARDAFHLQATAHGDQGTSIDLQLDGKPRFRGRGLRARPVGLDAVVEVLELERNGERWRTVEPATVVYDRGLRLSGLRLVSGRQALSLDATIEPEHARVDVLLSGRRLDAHRLARLLGRPLPQPEIPELSMRVVAVLEREAGALDASLALGAERVLDVALRTPLDPRRALQDRDWRELPLAVEARLPGMELGVLTWLFPGVGGRLSGRIAGEGKLGHLSGTAALAIDRLQLGAAPLPRVALTGSFDGRQLEAALRTTSTGGGALELDARGALSLDTPLSASLRARGFQFDWRAPQAALRRLGLRLDGEATIAGTLREPTAEGALRVRDGVLAVASDPRAVTGIEADVSLRPHLVQVRRLSARVGVGTVASSGEARLAGAHLVTLDARAEIKRLPVVRDPIVAAVDGRLRFHGERKDGRFHGLIEVVDGHAKIPRLGDIRELQSTGPLADVRFVDVRARADGARRQPGRPLSFDVKVPGPFRVRSSELMVDLRGDLEVSLGGEGTTIRGEVAAIGGWVELFDRRYELDHVRIGFGGERGFDPALDIRARRRLADADIYIEVRGRASQPRLFARSDPPIYDEAQVLAIIATGDPGRRHFTERSLNSKIAGVVSGAVVGAIKDQLAPHLPIDVIKIETGETGLAGLTSTRIELGKYITDDVYVSYTHQFGNLQIGTRRLNANEGELEWRFRRRYVLDVVLGDAPAGRVDLFWTRRY